MIQSLIDFDNGDSSLAVRALSPADAESFKALYELAVAEFGKGKLASNGTKLEKFIKIVLG